MTLVVTADDLGLSSGVTRGILEAHRSGVATQEGGCAGSNRPKDGVPILQTEDLCPNFVQRLRGTRTALVWLRAHPERIDAGSGQA